MKKWKETDEDDDFIFNLADRVATQMDIVTVHEVNIRESCIDATVNIKTEWIDDR